MQAQTEARLRVGIDVGGTFTDLFMYDEVSGAVNVHKVSSTPADPLEAPINGLRQLLKKVGARGDQVTFVGLGTTVATNAFLERKGARTGLITTRGFRDLLEIGRQTRPHLYDAFARKPAQIVPRDLRCEVSERIGADATVVTELDEGELRDAIASLRRQNVQSIAICFLNSYVDPRHESRAAEIVRQSWPEVCVVSSCEVVPEFREYERFVSTTINAYLMPAMRSYFSRFAKAIADLSIKVPPLVMSSSGGVFTPEMAGLRPIDTLFSGPSGGVSGAVFVSGSAQLENIVTFDMGGTSTEVCLVRDGKPQLSRTRVINGFPIRTTSHDIHTIGAGGSSIGAVDAGGMLQVGPQSAGADPGPACYAGGGAFATVTDANVVLGRLNQEHLLGGALAISSRKSVSAIERDVATPKGIDVRRAAASIIALAEANMAQAIRVVSVERGIDPKDFTLVAIGGAGPLHAGAVAREVGMAGLLVPLHPGVLCAMGVLTKDVQLDFSRTKLIDTASAGCCAVTDRVYAHLEHTARTHLAGQEAAADALRYERSAAVRYRGQNHEIDVPVPEAAFDQRALLGLVDRFHRAHEELYGYRFEDNAVELVTLRVAAIIPVGRPRIEPLPESASPPGLPYTERTVTFDEDDPVRCPIYARGTLRVGQKLAGPVIVEQMDTTIVVPPGFRAVVDGWLNIVIHWDP